jgi:hypothetical protein
MKRPTHGPSLPLSLIRKAGPFALALLVLGCVNLDKPENVRICASSPQGCSDNPTTKEGDAAVLADGQKDLPPGRADAAVTPDAAKTAGEVAAPSDLTADRSARKDVVAVEMDAEPDDAPANELGGPDSVDLPADLPAADLPATTDLPEPDMPTMDLADGASELGIDGPVGQDATFDTSPEVASSCIAQIISNGYKAGSARPCSACTDGNGGSLASQCTQMLDCLAPPSTSANYLYCLNRIHGSSLVGDCVDVLTKAGCPGGY